MSPESKAPGVVMILRSGYLSEDHWRAAVNRAIAHGLDVHGVDLAGVPTLYRAADGPLGQEEEW